MPSTTTGSITAAQKYQRIWQTVLHIPVGKVASYGQIADLAGLPGRARLVGKALGLAPSTMNLPWQRVIRSDRQLAFKAGSPNALNQQQLLMAEGVLVLNNRVPKVYFWQPDLAEIMHKLQY
ncbi:cysteine methyltransferase [Rheinheimera salexigens]|uniref:Cysteine methyltransferase n=2 Tax=Rheinheimera salexigens TaxID=1628148 RepID=A0A1E7QAM5_9GAMM|nr:cysteine methyltransferase [Rheinheimera salexigens]